MQLEVRQRLEALGVKFEQRLGSGAFAEVWRVRFRGVVRALRVSAVPVGDSPRGRVVARERDTLRQIVVIPELCNAFGFIEEVPLHTDAGEFFVTIWQVATTHLADWWSRSDSPAKEERLLAYLEQGAQNIDLLHAYGFHHRDVKAENFLVDGETARLCDFGMARQVGISTYCGTLVGTPGHIPPEMLERGESNPTHDLYGLAATYLRLKTGLNPSAFLTRLGRGAPLPGLREGEASVLAAALQPLPAHRYRQSAVAWVRWLRSAAGSTPALAPSTAPAEEMIGGLHLHNPLPFPNLIGAVAVGAACLAGANLAAGEWFDDATLRIAAVAFFGAVTGIAGAAYFAALRGRLLPTTLRLDRAPQDGPK